MNVIWEIEEWKGIEYIPNAFATSTPIAVANNELLKLPNSSQCHLINGGCGMDDGDQSRWLCELCGFRVPKFRFFNFEKRNAQPERLTYVVNFFSTFVFLVQLFTFFFCQLG
jgi:hypothetical protein